MVRWSEQRGFTLELSPETGASSEAAQFVRLSLLRRNALLSRWFNVQESRAEHRDQAGPRSLGEGRMLSWRWLSRREAEDLLATRLETLASLGYEILDSSEQPRGDWDWLRDLVRQQLRPAAPGEQADAPSNLAELLAAAGLDADQTLRGVAEACGLQPDEVREPNARVVGRCDGEQLALLVPFLANHDDPTIQSVGEAWATLPSTAYEVDQRHLRDWMAGEDTLSGLLGPRVHQEGLALLGPEGLADLASHAQRATVREAAGAWLDRLPGVGR